MKPKTFILIAGEASGDLLAAELVGALRQRVVEVDSVPPEDVQPLRTGLAPVFFGAGGPRMAAAGVDLAFDLTQHSVIGFSDVLKKYFEFRRLFHHLFHLALERQPDAIIGVDFGGFNSRFLHAIRHYVRRHRSEFVPWNPKLIQFVSPQVWASRPGRAYRMAQDLDLLLSIFPFERDWYAARVPKLRVEFVGNPMVDRYFRSSRGNEAQIEGKSATSHVGGHNILLLPGSRPDEVRRHLPLVVGAWKLIRAKEPKLSARMVLPSDTLAKSAGSATQGLDVAVRTGHLAEALAQADLAITKSGTVTLECAFTGVPAVVFYRTSWPTYFLARMIASVRHVAMPNLLAKEELFPEFVQARATPENIAGAALALLHDASRREGIQAKMKQIVSSLGGPGAIARAADAIVRLLK